MSRGSDPPSLSPSLTHPLSHYSHLFSPLLSPSLFLAHPLSHLPSPSPSLTYPLPLSPSLSPTLLRPPFLSLSLPHSPSLSLSLSLTPSSLIFSVSRRYHSSPSCAARGERTFHLALQSRAPLPPPPTSPPVWFHFSVSGTLPFWHGCLLTEGEDLLFPVRKLITFLGGDGPSWTQRRIGWGAHGGGQC